MKMYSVSLLEEQFSSSPNFIKIFELKKRKSQKIYITIKCYLFIYLFIPTWGYVDWFFRERERETLMWERNIHVKEKHWLVTSYKRPDWGWNPKPRYVPRLGIKPATFWCTGRCSNQLSHLARATIICF